MFLLYIIYILNSRWSRLLLTKQWEKTTRFEMSSDCIRDETHNFLWLGTRRLPSQLQIVNIFWVVVSNIFYFHPYLGKWSNLTNIFQVGWNHQPVLLDYMGVWQSRRCIDQIRQVLSAAFAWSCLSSQTPDATFYHQRVQCLHMFCRWGDPVWSTEFSMHWLLRMEICWNIKPLCSRKSQTTSFRHIQHVFMT